MASKWTFISITVIGVLLLLNIGVLLIYPAIYDYTHQPNGWLYRVRSISFDGTTFNDYHGLDPSTLSMAAGYPQLGVSGGINPGASGPWSVWTDWEDDDIFLGRDEEPLDSGIVFTYFNAFQVVAEEDGNYTICLGSDDGCELWMDGVKIFEVQSDDRGIRIDDDVITDVPFTAGSHYFIFIVYQFYKETGFCFRIKDSSDDMVTWQFTGTSSTFFYYLIFVIPLLSVFVVFAYILVYFTFRNTLFKVP